uniref:Transmembrane protein 68-like n=1 Tax=Podarcis muralis TaxID=64176 RepID=A0A670I2P2_PODMU
HNIYLLPFVLYSGYEVIGLEHLPKGPGIVIFHHSIWLRGYCFFVCKAYEEKGRLCHSVIDHFLYKLPGLARWVYEKTRCLLLPVYGGFPVKLRTYIGEPIPYDPNITATELAEKTKTALENLRDRHQKMPGNILRALSERFDKDDKAN